MAASKPLTIVFRASAQLQAVQAQAWYESKRAGLGAEFARNLDAAMNRVSRHPFAAMPVGEDVRRVVLRRFPYSVFCLVEPDRLVALSCLHTRRDPAAWPY